LKQALTRHRKTGLPPESWRNYHSNQIKLKNQAAGDELDDRIVNLPFSVFTAAAAAYRILGNKKSAGGGPVVLAVAGIIVILVMCIEAIACKPMHIPEYILSAWLLHHTPVLGCKARGFQIVD
jgi:hypothetical protein